MSQHGSEAETTTAKSSVTALVPIWDSGEQSLMLSHNRTFRAGRGRDCDLLIAHPGVAEWHATVIQIDGQVSVRPEHGQHVWVNDQLIDQAATVQTGDTLAIGPATFRIEARRAGRRMTSSRSKSAGAALPDVSVRLEQHLNVLQQQYSNAMQEVDAAPALSGPSFEANLPVFTQQPLASPSVPPRLPNSPSASHGTPFLDLAATTNRRSALDERESQLNEWHRSLDRRREELDKRSANLTKQQAALTARQAELDHRTAELESWQQSALEDIEDRKANVNTAAEADLRLQKQQLQNQERELVKEQQLVSEQLRRMEDSRQSIADQLKTLEDARSALKDERAELAEERSRLESETRARQQADSEQEAAFQEQRQKLDHFASQLEEERCALQQQEASLRDEQQRLEARTTEVADAEERIQLVAASPISAEDDSEPQQQDSANKAVQHIDESATDAALLLLEEQKTNLAEQQNAVQQQLDAVRRKEDEFDLLKTDVEDQLADLAAAQTALEFDRAEAASALEEAKRLQKEAEDAQAISIEEAADTQAETVELSDPRPSVEDDALRQELATREQELSERTQELANRLAELKTWKKELEAREVASSESPPVASEATEETPAVVERPKSVIASQLSSLLISPGMVPEADGLIDSASDEKSAASEHQNASLQTETTELRERVAELEQQLNAAEQESISLSSLLTQSGLPTNGRALTEQNLLAELRALKSELSDSQDTNGDAIEDDEQVVVQSQIAELEARNEAMLENHQQEIARYEDTISELNHQLELVQKQFEGLEERTMAAVAAASKSAASVDDSAVEDGAAANGPTEDGAVEDRSGEKDSAAADDDDQSVQKLTEMVQQLSDKLEQRNNTIDNLQAQLNGGIPVDSSASMSPQELNVLSQELDSRTVLLDEREAALRERERLFEQSEQELQAQRVALQEARQQLELTRAEIHSAREPDASESTLLPRDLIDSVTELAEAGASSSMSTDEKKEEKVEVEEVAEEQNASVRSEFAELFGLGAKAKIETEEEPTARVPATAAELMEAVDDYSQESAAAVSLSFESAQDMLMAPDAEPVKDITFDDKPEVPEQDEADDVVASYMEQLLSRSRAHADGDLSEKEHNPASNATVAAKKKQPKKVPGQSSFIDKYMSGEYSSDSTSTAAEEGSATTSESAADAQSANDESAELRRSKIDREAQRLDLQSFRELSTQSAANALAAHARRQQKGGIATRTTILTTLGLISVFVLSAAIIGVIPFGWLSTLSIIAVCVSAGELAYKMKTIQDEVNEQTRLAMNSSSVKGTSFVAADADAPLNETAEPEAGVESPVVANSSVQNPSQSADEVNSLETPNQPVETSQEPVQADADVVSTDVPANVSEVAQEAVDSTLESAVAESEPVEESAADVVSESAPAERPSAESEVETNADSNGGVPDSFDQAFRMLTSNSLPIKPDTSEAAAPETNDSDDSKPSAE